MKALGLDPLQLRAGQKESTQPLPGWHPFAACPVLCDDAGVDSGFQCAGCGEWNETQVDESAGSKQTYVEDCQVCCKPNVLHIRWNSTDHEFEIRAELE